MLRAISLQDVFAEAERQGYAIAIVEARYKVYKKHFPHVHRFFEHSAHFMLDERRVAREDYALLQCYYYVRGYDLDHGADGDVLLSMNMRHRLFQQNSCVEKHFDFFEYEHLSPLHRAMLEWVKQVEQNSSSQKGA